jgi:hypothetical protein
MQAGSVLDVLTKIVTLVSLCVALYAASLAVPADSELKRLQADTQRLDNELKQAGAALQGLESDRKLTFELYKEVRDVLSKKEATRREEAAVQALVESLAEEPFRIKLLTVLATGARNPEVREEALQNTTYFTEQLQVETVDDPGAEPDEPAPKSGLASLNVDVFYCDERKATSQPVATVARGVEVGADSGRWRLRSLPESINQRPGYQISSNVLRFNAPDERDAAEELARRLKAKSISVELRESISRTPNYLAVFICQ